MSYVTFRYGKDGSAVCLECESVINPSSEFDLDEVLEAFEDEDYDRLIDEIDGASDPDVLYLYPLWDDSKATLEWSLGTEDGKEISHGTYECSLDEIEDCVDEEESIRNAESMYSNDHYMLTRITRIRNFSLRFEVPEDIDIHQIKLSSDALASGKFKVNSRYLNIFGAKDVDLKSFKYNDDDYFYDEEGDFESCEEIIILFKYNEKQKEWKIVKYLGDDEFDQ